MMDDMDKPKRPAPGRGLGRGLSALLGDSSPQEDDDGSQRTPVEVPVAFLQPGRFQPRTEFDQDALQDLAESIREKGVIQPILVRRLPEDPNRYEIIAGERRWRASQMVQRHTVPILIREFSDRDAMEVALIENLQRRDLSPLEEAEGYRRLQEEFSHSQEDLSRSLGKSRSHVANMMRLLALPDPVKGMLRDGTLSAGHARALLNAADPVSLAQQVIRKGLNVRQTEKLATEKGGVKARKPRPEKPVETQDGRPKDTDTIALERDLSNLLGLKVTIEFQGRGGRVAIQYETLEQLDDILYRLNNPTDNRADARRGEDGADDDDAAAVMAILGAGGEVQPEEDFPEDLESRLFEAATDAWGDLTETLETPDREAETEAVVEEELSGEDAALEEGTLEEEALAEETGEDLGVEELFPEESAQPENASDDEDEGLLEPSQAPS